VTQQNAALVEEAAAAAASLQEQAEGLSQIVSVFQLGGEPAPEALARQGRSATRTKPRLRQPAQAAHALAQPAQPRLAAAGAGDWKGF